jgi:hypothetical protein
MACFISSTLPPVRMQVALGAAADFAFADLAMASSLKRSLPDTDQAICPEFGIALRGRAATFAAPAFDKRRRLLINCIVVPDQGGRSA